MGRSHTCNGFFAHAPIPFPEPRLVRPYPEAKARVYDIILRPYRQSEAWAFREGTQRTETNYPRRLEWGTVKRYLNYCLIDLFGGFIVRDRNIDWSAEGAWKEHRSFMALATDFLRDHVGLVYDPRTVRDMNRTGTEEQKRLVDSYLEPRP